MYEYIMAGLYFMAYSTNRTTSHRHANSSTNTEQKTDLPQDDLEVE
jgi:hypothetical protein